MKKYQKVKIVSNGETEVGNIHEIYPPCEYHSGRIIVYIPCKHKPQFREFWYEDIGKTLFLENK